MDDYYISDYGPLSVSFEKSSETQKKMQPISNYKVQTATQHVKTQTSKMNLDKIFVNIVKYLVGGLFVSLIFYFYIGRDKLNVRDIFVLAILTAVIFMIISAIQ